VLRCHEGSVVCVLPLLAIADSSEACLIMTASAEGTMRVSHHCTAQCEYRHLKIHFSALFMGLL
jgi:hypothetical protein